MFLKPKILVTFYKKMRQGDLPQFVRSVLLKMENNPTYANLTEVLTQLKTDLETYVNALAAAEDGGKQKTADKDLAKEALINTIPASSVGSNSSASKVVCAVAPVTGSASESSASSFPASAIVNS